MTERRPDRCPSCNKFLFARAESWVTFLAVSKHLGDPLESCPKCKSVFPSGRKCWGDMTSKEKGDIWLRVIVSGIFESATLSLGALILLGTILKILNWLPDGEVTETQMWIACVLFIIAFILISPIVNRKFRVKFSSLKEIKPEDNFKSQPNRELKEAL